MVVGQGHTLLAVEGADEEDVDEEFHKVVERHGI